MIGSLLVRGMLVGVLAGVLGFGFARLFGEPEVDRALAFEIRLDQPEAQTHSSAMSMPKDVSNGMEMPSAEAAAPQLVSRNVQSGIGLLTGMVAFGTAFGGLFALVFAFVYGRVGRLSPRATALVLAAAGFVAIDVVPDLKYPASPPAVGLSETLGQRTALFFLMIAVSVAAMIVAVAIRQRLLARSGSWNASLIAAAGYIAIIIVTQFALPAVDEVPQNYPAAVLWNFRIVALGIQAIVWTTIGLLFGALAEGVMIERRGSTRPALG